MQKYRDIEKSLKLLRVQHDLAKFTNESQSLEIRQLKDQISILQVNNCVQ